MLNNLHKMEELIQLRSKRSRNGKFVTKKNSIMRFTVNGRFMLYQPLAQKLNLNNGDSVMFGISKKENCLYIFKEDTCEDNYKIVHQEHKSFYRFTSKNLIKGIINYLGLDKDKQDYFFESVGEVTDGKLKLIEVHKTDYYK